MKAWIPAIKIVLQGVASIGITFLANSFFGNIVSTSGSSKLPKACMAVGTSVLGFMICDAACRYIDTEVDDIYSHFETTFGAGKRISEEFEEEC